MPQEINYIPYGDRKVSLDPLVLSMASDVNNYVNQLPWTKSRKLKFLDAYGDILSKGITGANVNSSGLWELGLANNVDLDSKSKKDKEMYSEAAYYILQQMNNSSVEQEKEEEKKVEDLLLYNNDWHLKAFTGYIGNTMFGGRNWDYTKDWDVLDERDSNGIIGTSKRMAKLADMLEGYGNSLEEGKYNFEGSAFKDLNDLKTRINNAVTSLRTGVLDLNVKDSLNAVGLDWRQYLHDGSEDIVGLDENGNPVTRAEAMTKKTPEQNSNTAPSPTKLKNLLYLNTYNNKGLIKGKNINYLANKYNSNPQALLEALNSYKEKGLNNLNGDEFSELVGAIRYGGETISDLDFKTLKSFTRSARFGNNKNRFKKYKGLEGLLYDTATGQIIHILTKEEYNNKPSTNFMAGKSDKEIANTPRGKGVKLTTADYVDLGALAGDLASIIDPEPISGAVLGGSAAIARATNKDWKDNFWGSLGGTAVDLGTGVIGGIPIFGDAVLASKFISRLGKVLKGAAVYSAVTSSPEAFEAIKKIDFNHPIDSAKKLTPQDYHALYNVLTGLLAGKTHVLHNLAQRLVLKKRGVAVEDSWKQKSGLFKTKVKEKETVPTVKVKDNNGTEHEIPITHETKARLEKDFEGKTKELKDNILKANNEVKTSAQKAGVDLLKVKLAAARSPRNIPFVRNYVGTNKGIFGETSGKTINKSEDKFEKYLSERGTWDKIKYGSNRLLRAYDKSFLKNGIYKIGNSSTTANPTLTTPTQTTNNSSNSYIPQDIDDLTRGMLNNIKGSKRKMTRETSIPTSNSTIDGKLIDGSTFKVLYNGKNISVVDNGKTIEFKGSLHSQKKRLGQYIERKNRTINNNSNIKLKSSDPKWKDYVQSIKKLKRSHYLFKLGGQVNSNLHQIISEYLK